MYKYNRLKIVRTHNTSIRGDGRFFKTSNLHQVTSINLIQSKSRQKNDPDYEGALNFQI